MTDRTPTSLAAQSSPLSRLHENRLARWHQQGEALLTFENVRSWLNAAGLVLFAPLPQIATPAPTLVEAVLGAPTPNPSLQETEQARSLLTRMVAEGIAVPLNLLGTATGAVGETPDFIASAAVFSYIFTLRGDKAWKQPPVASGTGKVSQLAAHAYEILAKSGAQSASQLTAELGNAVSESAVLRALGELWSRVRVLPMMQQDGKPTLWELGSVRYTKQIKAGANAGQPSALSALASLYLGQVAVATEEEIEIFLSPLAPRSRTRDVLHALTAARQLETVAVEGRTMLYVAGEAPAFLDGEQTLGETVEVSPIEADPSATDEDAGSEESQTAAPGERIKKFVPKPRKVGTGPLAKGAPIKRAAKPFAKSTGSYGAKRAEGSGFSRAGRDDRGGERERRPFQKNRPDSGPSEGKPRFDQPWSEERPKRTSRQDRPSAGQAQREYRTSAARPRTERTERTDRTTSGGWKPAFRKSERPQQYDRGEQGSRPKRTGGFAKRAPGFSKGPAESPGAKRPFRSGDEGAREGSPRSFRKFDARPAGPRSFAGKGERGERKPFRPRPEGAPSERGSSSGGPPKFGANRSGPPRGKGFSGGPRREGFTPRPRGEGYSPRPRGEGFSGKPRAEGYSPRPRGGGFSGKPRSEGFSARPRAGRPDGARSFAKKGASSRPAARRTFKRKEDESA